MKPASGNRVPWQDILTAGFPKFELRGTPQETQTFGKGDGRTIWWRLFEGCRYPNSLVSFNEFEMHVSISVYNVLHCCPPLDSKSGNIRHLYGVQTDQCGCAIGNWSTKKERLQPTETWGRLVAKNLTIILLDLTCTTSPISCFFRV